MNPHHVDVVVFTYAERAPGEAMTTPPSVGKSEYLKIVPETFQWAIVEPDFPGEADVTERYRGVTDEGSVVFEHMNYTSYRLTRNGQVEEGALNTERGYGDDVDATVYVLNWQQPESEWIQFVRLTNEPGVLYFLDTNRDIVPGRELRLMNE
jgi:hypothetical protein